MKMRLLLLAATTLLIGNPASTQAQNQKKTDLKTLLSKMKETSVPVKKNGKSPGSLVEKIPEITAELNLPRPKDILTMEAATYFDPGEAGQDIVWDFSSTHMDGTEHTIGYFNRKEDEICGAENGNLFYYGSSGDSLTILEFENPSTIAHYQQPEILLTFPSTYLSSSGGFQYGKGKYCDRLEYLISGFTETLTDGYGKIILPGKDTLENVLRVHIKRRSVEHRQPLPENFNFRQAFDFEAINDSLAKRYELSGLTETDIYRWYARGYRYPVAETVSSRQVQEGQENPISQAAFIFPPQAQRLLAEDTANLAVLQKPGNALRNTLVSKELPHIRLEESISIVPNPVVDQLRVSIQLVEKRNVQMYLFDTQGKLVYQHTAHSVEGNFSKTIDMGHLPEGIYILHAIAGSEVAKKKIVKQ